MGRPFHLALAFAAALETACIAGPPMQLGGGIAAAGSPPTVDVGPAAHIHARVRPMAAAESLLHRKFDIGVGASAQYLDRGEGHATEDNWLVGPTLGFDVYPITEGTDPVYRLAVGGELRALYQPGLDVWAPVAAPRVGVEVAGFVKGCGSDASTAGVVFGCGVGEGGIGAYFEPSVGYLDGRLLYAIALTLEVRTPAGLLLLIPFPK